MRGRKFSLVGGPGQKKNKCPPLMGKTLICCGFKMNYLLCLSSVSFLFFKFSFLSFDSCVGNVKAFLKKS